MSLARAAAALRVAQPSDAPAIIALEQHFPGDRMSAAAVRRLLQSASARLWVAEDGSGALVAAIVVLTRRGSRRARIYSLVVAPHMRGAGLARRLVQTAEDWARSAGLRVMALEVRSDNAAARALYGALGYQETEALPAYYDDGGDGLRLQRRLDAG